MRISGLDGGRPVSLLERADTLSLALTDDTAAQWELVVRAFAPDGPAVAVTFRTAPPSAGSSATRYIGFVHVPGARSWDVEPRLVAGSAPAATVADLNLAGSCGPAGFVGGVANGAFAVVVP